MTAEPASRPRGRPRDPQIEPRVHEAALQVYAERGWYGFSLEAVCRRAHVGPSALYRRWTSKSELLASALLAAERPLPDIDTGSSREDLLALVRHLVALYRSPSGVIGLRMVLDARTHPELAEQLARMIDNPRAREVRRIVRRGMARGDVRFSASAGVVLNTLMGATLTHVLLVPAGPEVDGLTVDDEVFLADLVDGVLGPR